MNLLVVESPAKAKTISKYLGKDYTVIASVGHVRDLDSKQGSVHIDGDLEMDWQIDPKKEKNLKEMERVLKTADTLYLAPDPDREGEAIAWHVYDILKNRKALEGKTVKRVVFHEVTKTAVQKALENTREIDYDMVDAYLGRRALDYLVGYTLSPVLWRKLPGSKSAGRVQSVALRLITEREDEIDLFVPRPYFSLTATFATQNKKTFEGRLFTYGNEKVEKFFFKTKEEADKAKSQLESQQYSVSNIEKKQVSRHAFAPFTTSTLQQEAARKLRFSAKKTMMVAQGLYEGVSVNGETVGLITYMRTDSVNLSQEALTKARSVIGTNYGEKYLPEKPNFFANKSKNAQEAHEAIRPTHIDYTPNKLKNTLSSDQQKLYELIWKRTVASQMTPALFDQVSADIQSADQNHLFRAVGTTQIFDGFLTLYQEIDEDKEDEKTQKLPALNQGDKTDLNKLDLGEHETKAPPRYTEASLVKKLEEMGIGRPSTYASILSVNQDRGYVRLENRRFVPEDRGRLTVAFLQAYFENYMHYDFTAKMEETLDDISNGKINWKKVIKDFWHTFIAKIDAMENVTFDDVRAMLHKSLGKFVFKSEDEKCPKCGSKIDIRLGKFGGFIGCEKYPECKYTSPLFGGEENGDAPSMEGVPLGVNPATNLDIFIKTGPYGDYIQEGDGERPKRISLPKGLEKSSVTLETALSLIALPRKLTDTIEAGLGRFGPFLKSEGAFYRLPKEYDVLTVTAQQAEEILANTPKKDPGKEIGLFKKKPVLYFSSGRYGPYVKQGKTMVSIPKDSQGQEPTIEQATQWLENKLGKDKPKPKTKAKPKRE
ncbi:MAG: type I DNA topoisomerase [Alphaproteobacteria bacterium]|nr:type I DNA topoisomerase [Alphaproteobacteria bacterium]MBN2779456.1 type I DNA topoisomerase [Alphaproteobacteria bacterium]